MSMDFGKFLKNPEFDIKITTYRDIFQCAALESDRSGEDYRKISALIMLGKNDMQKMGIKTGDRVRIQNSYGNIVVEAKESARNEPGGLAFMVNSPWSNALVSDETGGKGMVEFKNISARISVSKDNITDIEQLAGFKF